MFVTRGDAQVPLLNGIEAQVDVAGQVVATDFLFIVRSDAIGDLCPRIGTLAGARMAGWEYVAAVDVRSFGAGLGLVAIASMLETEGDIQRFS